MSTFRGVKVLKTQDILELLEFKDMNAIYAYFDESPNEIIAMLLATILHQQEEISYLETGSDSWGRPEEYQEYEGPLQDD